MGDRLLTRGFFDRPAPEVAPDLLGRVLIRDSGAGTVAVRLTEVEAYSGASDPASHAYRGRTARNAVMFGDPGHAYVYFTYGMHFCVNLVCMPRGEASAVLLRAGEVIAGVDLARRRRGGTATDRDIARGPARLCQALGITREEDGLDVCDPDGPLRIVAGSPDATARIERGPRTGISLATEVPWRFHLAGDRTVSPYRKHLGRRRGAAATVFEQAPAPPIAAEQGTENRG